MAGLVLLALPFRGVQGDAEAARDDLQVADEHCAPVTSTPPRCGSRASAANAPTTNRQLFWKKVPGNPFRTRGKTRIQNATWSTSGEELHRAWEKVTKEDFDGVLAVDVPTVASLFTIAGPIEVGDDGSLTYRLDVDPRGMVTAEDGSMRVHWPAGYDVRSLPTGWARADGRTTTWSVDGPVESPRWSPADPGGSAGDRGISSTRQLGQDAELIIPAPTVLPVASSMRMNDPVVRFLE